MKASAKYLSVLAITALLVLLFFTTGQWWLLVIAALVLTISILFSKVASGIHTVWSHITKAIAFILNNLILSVVFFLFITPVSLLKKAFRKKGSSAPPTGYVVRDHLYTREDLEKTW